MTKRRRISKLASVEEGTPGQTRLFPGERLLDMPLAKRRRVPGAFLFQKGEVRLQIDNLEDGALIWKLDLARTEKDEPADLAGSFGPEGGRHTRPFDDVQATLEDAAPDVIAETIDGLTEFGIQTKDDHEYFLSKFGDLVGVLRIQRKEDGSWKAGLSKSNVPRVLSSEAVEQGLMPPPGHSGLPKSLEAVVPAEYQYWKAQGDTARQMRDALVEQAFFSDDCIKAVDGELRKVEVKYFLFEPAQAATGKSFEPPSLATRVNKIIPNTFEDVFAPMAEAEDWLEHLDKSDAVGALAMLSPVDRAATSPREMVRAVKAIKAHYLLEHDDTRFARACFSNAGIVFKLDGEPSRVFCTSFLPNNAGVRFLKQGASKTIDFQGLSIHIDRPKGFVQTGKDENGNEWSREYQLDYGFLPRTQGGDGMELDVFVGPSFESERVFWVTQNKADGSFDEYKIFVGFDSPAAAREAYTSHIPARFYGGMAEVPLAQVKALTNVDPVTLSKRLTACAVQKVNGVSLDEVRRAVGVALDDAYPKDTTSSSGAPYNWVEDLYPDAAIFSRDGVLQQVGYTYANGSATLDGNCVPVMRTYVPVAEGAGTAPAAMQMHAKRTKKAVAEAAEQVSKTALRIATTKAEGEEQYVLGIVLEPDVVDAQDDTYSADEVRKASERFMEMHRNMGLMHQQKVNDKVQILENYLAPCDMQIGGQAVKKGTWLMGVRVKDASLWSAVKSGELTGFSIGGSAIRTPADQGV